LGWHLVGQNLGSWAAQKGKKRGGETSRGRFGPEAILKFLKTFSISGLNQIQIGFEFE
jgi:hypothetical protein